jgi:hypothetical protein
MISSLLRQRFCAPNFEHVSAPAAQANFAAFLISFSTAQHAANAPSNESRGGLVKRLTSNGGQYVQSRFYRDKSAFLPSF